jgi:hypothetical protein
MRIDEGVAWSWGGLQRLDPLQLKVVERTWSAQKKSKLWNGH